MKKIPLFLTSAVVALAMTFSSFAAANYEIAVTTENTKYDIGETFSVFVELERNAGFGALEAAVTYDSDVLTCTRVKAGSLVQSSGALFAGNPSTSVPAFAAINAFPVEGTGAVAELVFLATGAGTTSIGLTNLSIATLDGVAQKATSGSISITINASDVTPPVEMPDDPIEDPGELPVEPPNDEPDVPNIAFLDVPKTHWAYTYIQNAVQNGLFSGIGNGQFGPGMNVTRGMFVTTLYSSAGSPDVELSDFSDVADNAWYAKAVAWASQKGIVSGIGNNKFGPDLPITREQIALILYNYADGISPGTEAFVRIGYTDGKDIHDWALTAFTWAMNKELIAGKAGNILDPLATATRAEVAVIMQNFVNLSK